MTTLIKEIKQKIAGKISVEKKEQFLQKFKKWLSEKLQNFSENEDNYYSWIEIENYYESLKQLIEEERNEYIHFATIRDIHMCYAGYPFIYRDNLNKPDFEIIGAKYYKGLIFTVYLFEDEVLIYLRSLQ